MTERVPIPSVRVVVQYLANEIHRQLTGRIDNSVLPEVQAGLRQGLTITLDIIEDFTGIVPVKTHTKKGTL